MVSIAIALFAQLSGVAKPTISWRGDFESAFSEAGKSGKSVMLYVTTGPDRESSRMELEVFKDPRVIAKSRNMVAVKLTRLPMGPISANHEFQVSPTIYFLSPDGAQSFDSVGYVAPRRFLRIMDVGLMLPSVQQMETRSKAQLGDFADLEKLTLVYAAEKKRPAMERAYEALARTGHPISAQVENEVGGTYVELEPARAYPFFARARRAAERTGDRFELATALLSLATIDMMQGDRIRAVEPLREYIKLAPENAEYIDLAKRTLKEAGG